MGHCAYARLIAAALAISISTSSALAVAPRRPISVDNPLILADSYSSSQYTLDPTSGTWRIGLSIDEQKSFCQYLRTVQNQAERFFGTNSRAKILGRR
jgi:hypothetical protein